MNECRCHGVPLRWRKDRRRKNGGSWICRVIAYEQAQRYRQSAKGKAAVRRYSVSQKGRASRKKYSRGDKARANRARYRQSEKGRKLIHSYNVKRYDESTWRERNLNQLRVRRYKALQAKARRGGQEVSGG